MSRRALMLKSVAVVAVIVVARPATAQLYAENFDSLANLSGWSINTGGGTDKHADLFNYATVGIPSAPNSVGGTTKGMKLQANISAGVAGGANVSPIGKSFAGDYRLVFDMWSNFIGATINTPSATKDGLREGGNSSTKFSAAGILSSGTGDDYMTASRTGGVAEALYFAATGDAQTDFDYHVHGPGVPASDHGPNGFRSTVETTSGTAFNNWDAVNDAGVTFADVYPTGHPSAGKTNRGAKLDPDVAVPDPNNVAQTDGALYQAAFPAVAAPAAQATAYSFTQFDTTMPGAFGMAWRTVEIKKIGDIVTWSVLNGGVSGNQTFLLATVDISQLEVKTFGGTNIMFGESDPTANVGDDPDFVAMQFTLIDNVKVETVPNNSDFDNNGTVDGADFMSWQKGQGLTDELGRPRGNANTDTNVNAADLGIWKTKFGGPPATASAGAVPEPGSLMLAVFGVGSLLGRRRI